MKIEDLNPYVLEYLKKRGFDSPEAIRRYLSFGEDDLRRVSDLCGGEQLLARLEEAVRRQQAVVVYGDYDADGVMAVFILYSGLDRLMPGRVRCFINNRFEDGYTITPESMDKMLEACPETEVILTCDNGISAAAAIDYVMDRGVSVLVTDHHGQAEAIRSDCPVVDEKSFAQRQADDAAGISPELFCGAELARRVITELYERLGISEENRDCLDDLYAYSGFATITDSVPMTAANHYVARRGLEKIRQGSGVWGLLNEMCGQQRGSVDGDTVGYKYGPMVNASSRVTGSAKSALLVFVQFYRGRIDRCRAAIEVLLGLNDERRRMCQEDDELAFRLAEAAGAGDRPFILLADPGFREGINGLTAAHLVERYHVPAAVLSPTSADAAVFKGSARSVEGFDLFAALDSCRDYVQSGGHPMAAGLSVALQEVEKLRSAMEEQALAALGPDWKARSEIAEAEGRHPADFVFTPDELSVKIVEELGEIGRLLMPFGPGLEPVRVALRIGQPRLFAMRGRDGTDRHAKFLSSQRSRDRLEVSAIWWNRLEEARQLEEASGETCVFVGDLQFNSYRDRSIQMIVSEAGKEKV